LLSFGLLTKEDAARPARESCDSRIYAPKHQANTAEITEGKEKSLNGSGTEHRRRIIFTEDRKDHEDNPSE
jgi:hypothetical protein